jgi:hypothetical protein
VKEDEELEEMDGEVEWDEEVEEEDEQDEEEVQRGAEGCRKTGGLVNSQYRNAHSIC